MDTILSHLTKAGIKTYNEKGYLTPIDAISSQEAEKFRANYYRVQKQYDMDVNPILRSKPHLVFPWLYDLVKSPAITGPVSSILGPNLLAWGTSFFAKPANEPGFVSWHQDANYWGLEPHDVLTAWIAFTPSLRENGCMRIVPGSHLKGSLEHKDTFSEDNLLTRGQEISVHVNEKDATDIILSPGQMSLHHVSIVHGSDPNTSSIDRIGFAIRYISTNVKQNGGRTSATMARGTDEYKHFDLEPYPEKELDVNSINYREDALKRQHEILYKGAG